jgi:hypothetical protein
LRLKFYTRGVLQKRRVKNISNTQTNVHKNTGLVSFAVKANDEVCFAAMLYKILINIQILN